MKAKERVIVALDYPTLDEVQTLVNQLGDSIDFYKVGLEIFLNTQGKVIDFLQQQQKKIFLDLKFHDITNTTKMACEYAIKQDVFMFNIHAACGRTTMTEIAAMLALHQTQSKCIAVTVVTSMDQTELQETMLTQHSLSSLVMNLARLTWQSGLHGVVCSAHEAAAIKSHCGTDFLTVCPGIRPAGSITDDQKRIMAPGEVIKQGVDYLVIGRPITQALDPRYAALTIIDELETALAYK